jgi:hypothetical protein
MIPYLMHLPYFVKYVKFNSFRFFLVLNFYIILQVIIDREYYNQKEEQFKQVGHFFVFLQVNLKGYGNLMAERV